MNLLIAILKYPFYADSNLFKGIFLRQTVFLFINVKAKSKFEYIYIKSVCLKLQKSPSTFIAGSHVKILIDFQKHQDWNGRA